MPSTSPLSFSQDDKKFYQLELVNRETSFSKVFTSSANVGVINPLIKVSECASPVRVAQEPVGVCVVVVSFVVTDNPPPPPDLLSHT